jgi:CRP/FNR family transcriptional regulator, cyclic AMP receptor protein
VNGVRAARRATLRTVELLALALDRPRRNVGAEETLIADGLPVPALYVLVEGALRIEKAGVAITTVSEPGACIGEMSLLLDVPATADVVASEPSVVAVIDDAATLLESDPLVSLALARLLAVRLHAMTSYLADLKQQYADHEGGLGMVDVVLDRLMRTPARRSELGSERDPEPEY